MILSSSSYHQEESGDLISIPESNSRSIPLTREGTPRPFHSIPSVSSASLYTANKSFTTTLHTFDEMKPGQSFSVSSCQPSHFLYSYRPASALLAESHAEEDDDDEAVVPGYFQKDDSGFSNETPDEPIYVLTPEGDVVFYDDSATEYDISDGEYEHEYDQDWDEEEPDILPSDFPLVPLLSRTKSAYFSELDNPDLVAEDELPSDEIEDDDTIDGDPYVKEDEHHGETNKGRCDTQNQLCRETETDKRRHVPILYKRMYDDENEDDNTTTTGAVFEKLVADDVDSLPDSLGLPSHLLSKSKHTTKKTTMPEASLTIEEGNSNQARYENFSWLEAIFWAGLFTTACFTTVYNFPLMHYIPYFLSRVIGEGLAWVFILMASLTTGSILSIFVPDMKVGYRYLRTHRSYPHLRFLFFLFFMIWISTLTLPYVFKYLHFLSRQITVMGPTLVFGIMAYSGTLLFLAVLWMTFSLTRDMSSRLYSLLTGASSSSSNTSMTTNRVDTRSSEEARPLSDNGPYLSRSLKTVEATVPEKKRKHHFAESPYVFRP